MTTGNDVARKAMRVVAKAAITSNAPFLGVAVLDKVLGEDDVVDGLLKLIDTDHLPNLDLERISKLTSAQLIKDNKFDGISKAISNAIKLTQQDSSGSLKVDELLGIKTFNWILTAMGCAGKLKDANASNASNLSAAAKRLPIRVLRYRIEKKPDGSLSLPTASFNVRALLAQCFHNWAKVCGVTFADLTDTAPKEANVSVKLADIDLRGSVLADAHIGPPKGTYMLELRIDSAETWTEQKFEAAITHEIGHLLGLRHTSTPNQLMNTHVGTPPVTKPQDEDKRIAQNDLKWGKSKIGKRATGGSRPKRRRG